MASVTKVELVDDMDGGPADETVTFGLDGTQFEIDLAENKAGILRDILSDYVEAGRKVGKLGAAPTATQRRSNGSGVRQSREQTQAIREWGKANGYTISDRGRIPSQVQEAFDRTHQPAATQQAAPSWA